jgi:hypothetical protein
VIAYGEEISSLIGSVTDWTNRIRWSRFRSLDGQWVTLI